VNECFSDKIHRKNDRYIIDRIPNRQRIYHDHYRFLRTYANGTHHGKEEDILIKTLSKAKRSEKQTRTMNRLRKDHKTS
jgi:hemerythrin-like domain-containing protein